MALSINIMSGGSAAVLTMSGRVVAEDNVSLRKHIEQLMGSDAQVKAIDITDIEYIDSYALGQLIYYCNNAAGSRATVYMINRKSRTTSFIDRLIEVSDLRQVFTIVESLEAAILPADQRSD